MRSRTNQLRMTVRVAVYGTLKRGQDNFSLLQSARFLGVDVLTSITLYDLGPWPGARLEPSEGIAVEVFEVDTKQLQRLDELEDYDAVRPDAGMYNRVLLETRFGEAWVYLYQLPINGVPVIRSGGWPSA